MTTETRKPVTTETTEAVVEAPVEEEEPEPEPRSMDELIEQEVLGNSVVPVETLAPATADWEEKADPRKVAMLFSRFGRANRRRSRRSD